VAVFGGLEDGHGAKDVTVLDGEAIYFPRAGKDLGNGGGLGRHLSPWYSVEAVKDGGWIYIGSSRRLTAVQP
jgi:hypothetical protein